VNIPVGGMTFKRLARGRKAMMNYELKRAQYGKKR